MAGRDLGAAEFGNRLGSQLNSMLDGRIEWQ